MVPRALPADFDHVNPKFSEFLLHFKKFLVGLDPSGILPQLITEGVFKFDQRFLPAHWTGPICWGPVEFGSLQ